MTNFEMVELLREKANVSYEEARAALEEANWDLLDAMVLLEKQGRVSSGGGSYSTREERGPEEDSAAEPGESGAKAALKWLWAAFRKGLRVCNTNFFVVSRKDEELFSLPVTVFIVLLFVLNWFMLIAIVAGLFFGARYSFRGPNLGRDAINEVIGKATDVAENVKENIRNAGKSDGKTGDN